MLQHDYLLEIIAQFVEMATGTLRRAVLSRDAEAAGQAEDAIAVLLDLDPEVAMQLSPDSLVTMMLLSGVADSLAGYVAYALRMLHDAYASMGQDSLADLRLAQATAVEESFGCEPGAVPEEFADLDAELG